VKIRKFCSRLGFSHKCETGIFVQLVPEKRKKVKKLGDGELRITGKKKLNNFERNFFLEGRQNESNLSPWNSKKA